LLPFVKLHMRAVKTNTKRLHPLRDWLRYARAFADFMEA
jgi:hypothetical protein